MWRISMYAFGRSFASSGSFCWGPPTNSTAAAAAQHWYPSSLLTTLLYLIPLLCVAESWTTSNVKAVAAYCSDLLIWFHRRKDQKGTFDGPSLSTFMPAEKLSVALSMNRSKHDTTCSSTSKRKGTSLENIRGISTEICRVRGYHIYLCSCELAGTASLKTMSPCHHEHTMINIIIIIIKPSFHTICISDECHHEQVGHIL